MTAQTEPSSRARRALLGLLLVLAGAATVWLVAQVMSSLMVVTTSVVAALLLTALLGPVVDRLEGLRLTRAMAALVTLVLSVAALTGFGWVLVERVSAQSDSLGKALRDSGKRLRSLVLDSPVPISGDQLDRLPAEALKGLQDALPGAVTGAGMVANVLTSMALTLFLWFFLLKDGRQIWQWWVSWMPARRRATWTRSGPLAWEVLSSYVRGTVVIAAADAVGTGIAMAVLRVPLTLSLSVLVFLGAFVPIAGTTVAGALAVAVTLVTVGPLQALLLLGAVLVVQQVEGNLLQPLVMGRALHLHPAAIVLVVTVGTLAAGVIGALTAVPLVAIIYRVSDDLLPRRAGTA